MNCQMNRNGRIPPKRVPRKLPADTRRCRRYRGWQRTIRTTTSPSHNARMAPSSHPSMALGPAHGGDDEGDRNERTDPDHVAHIERGSV